MGKIILGSSSPRRADILKKLKLDYEIIPSGYVEPHDQTDFSYSHVEDLAYNKALDDLNKNTNVWASYDLTMKFTEARENLEAAQRTFADTSKAVKDASNNWSTAQTTFIYIGKTKN